MCHSGQSSCLPQVIAEISGRSSLVVVDHRPGEVEKSAPCETEKRPVQWPDPPPRCPPTIKAPVTRTNMPPLSFDGCASVVSTRCWTFWKGRFCQTACSSVLCVAPNTPSGMNRTTHAKFLNNQPCSLKWLCFECEHRLVALRRCLAVDHQEGSPRDHTYSAARLFRSESKVL